MSATAAVADLERTRGFMRDLEEVESVYRRLIALTRNQSRILQGGLSPELLELARAKEEELGRIAEIEKRMAPARSVWPALREQVPPALKSEVQAVILRVEAVLRELLGLEETEGKALAARRDETIAQIRRLDSARKVRGAYGSGQAPPALLDQKE